MVWVMLYFSTGLVVYIIDPPTQPEGKYATITHETYNFTIEYPTKWQVYTYGANGNSSDKTVKLELKDYRQTVVQIYYQPADNPTLEDVSHWGTEILAWIKEKEIHSERSDTVNGNTIIRRRYDTSRYRVAPVCGSQP